MTAFDDEVTGWALDARSGDRDALERFVRATQRDVWRFVAHLTGVGVADDLAQETYARALPSLHRFAGRSSARAWLLAIARRVVVDQVRMAQSRPRLSSGSDWVREADRRAVDTGFEGVVELNVLLDALDPARREALVLTQVLGLSYAEAADVAGCPVGTIRSRVARARDDLLHAAGNDSSEVG
ncbi:sigma-70 family RNA polymerase sigma factor [Saccharothrix sp. S26]|uniref:sigma-70 family RNA polymerase sigma factor n=1 Tax=Saccharothrix sp. S26 TaxID=2907215 RepID=UPI001F249DF3|nr:sigma-70 family RNA polymerase sigma factor [Saccharothrix sp. S26]MCE6996360.1 sigma-70 family RNA polymerase sigma factor [Saccharothrix sp. S26]